jgi:phosphomannomutase
MPLADLRVRAELWLKEDPDPTTQAELSRLLAEPDLSRTDLADRFSGALEFGTAGLRGVIGAGPNRMNRAVVLRTTCGLARYLLDAVKGARERGVAIGLDGRRMSREFAEDTACVLAAHGIVAHVFRDYAPTPLTAFAVERTGAVAGVMVTASHNPPEYNGYKVYWTNAAQIIPPIDAGIAAAIAAAPPACSVPRLPIAEARARGLVLDMPADVEEAYVEAVGALQTRAELDRSLRIVYTPMHGVGGRLAGRVFAAAGFGAFTEVPEQSEPDGAFPTVAFPNPEEKGAMDLSFALAKKIGADLVLANDPDADRLAVAIPRGDAFVQLTGNQVGVLLGHYLLSDRGDEHGGERLVLASNVSSPMLGEIAKDLGVRYEETLTGFKWIANRAMALEKERGLRFVFGYEEALGYTAGTIVRDKDGISAAVLFAEFAAALRARGSSVLARLEELYRKYGFFASSQVNLAKKGADGAEQIRALMRRLRTSPPHMIGRHEVVAIADYASATRTELKTGQSVPITLPQSNVLAFELRGGSRVIARPSGTEPKVKFYFDVREPLASSEPLADAQERAETTMRALADAFVALA